MEKRSVIVTGGGQGIGKAIVQHWLAEGWHVAAFDKDAQALADLKREMAHARLLTVTCDVGREAAVTRSMKRTAAWLTKAGIGGIDLLV